MVKEMRKIILSRDELIEALETHKRDNPDFLPAGKIAGCELRTGAPVMLNIESTWGNKVQAIELPLEASKLLEPMIRFCIERNIILPRHSRKSALTGDDQAVLYIQMDASGSA